MADDFAQVTKGIHADGETIVSTDGILPVAVKKGTVWTPLTVNETSGGLEVEILKLTSSEDDANVSVYGSDDAGTTKRILKTTADGTVEVNLEGDVNVTATDLDIRDLTATTDEVGIGDGTNSLAVNADGSINVNTAAGNPDSIYEQGDANLVKDTATTVLSRAAAADENYSGLIVSGFGLCEWDVQFGTTGAEATIMKIRTTPSNPTQYVDLPDNLIVSSGETIKIVATNKEKGGSPKSDFEGSASLVRGA